MSGTEDFRCQLELCKEEGPRGLKYTDNHHLGRTFYADIDTDGLRQATTLWLTRSLKERADFCGGEGLRLLGRHLYERIFRGEIDTEFRLTFGEFEKACRNGKRATLRLVLVFHPDAESLADLPWEFLYLVKPDNNTGTFLSGEMHTLVLTRMVPDLSIRTGPPLTRPLRVLLAVCTPSGRDAGTVDGLQRQLRTEVHQKRVELKELNDPTYSDLAEAMHDREFEPDVVHFVGHGEPGALIMRRDEQRIAEAQADYDKQRSMPGAVPAPVESDERVDTSKVEALFASEKPRLVFLQACYGAAVGRDVNVLYSTAIEIVKKGVPAVVAMQYEIGAEEADRFAQAFYDKLIVGCTIGEAVSHGRTVLAVREQSSWAHRDFGTPVVYVDTDTDEKSVVQPREEFGKDVQQASRSCPRCAFVMRHRVCPKCKLRLDCQCRKTDSGCSCDKELEYPQGGFCAACEHEFAQEEWSVEKADDDRAEMPVKPVAAVRQSSDAWDAA